MGGGGGLGGGGQVGVQGSYRNMKTKFQDFSRIILGLLSVFKDSISLTFSQFLLLSLSACRKG